MIKEFLSPKMVLLDEMSTKEDAKETEFYWGVVREIWSIVNFLRCYI